jgi:adenosylhomocysteine nucleosidase
VIEHADVVDMENFAVAALCKRKGIPLVSVKYITDKIGENSVQHWEDKLHDANLGLQRFFKQWAMAIE